MKNYSLDYESSKLFILNYNIENNQIIINLASGEKYIIPYTTDNEKKILGLMKNQVNRSDDHEYEQEKRFSRSVILAILNFFGLVTFSILLATGMTINIIFIIILIIFESTDIYDMINSKLIIKDIKKNKMFVDYEEILSDNNKINQNVLSNTSSKTQELVSSIPEQKTIFNLNNIDKISYKDLKQILENIKREEKFDFDYSNIQDEKPMILSKKRK